ncbi:MAG: purine phosphorylase [Candidatus Heimdallarchaeota archaeon]|nr:purine phosphorylase [Candidatus Heimdallarchaeota archaeon]
MIILVITWADQFYQFEYFSNHFSMKKRKMLILNLTKDKIMSYPNFPRKYSEKAIVTPKEYINYKKKRGYYSDFIPPESVIFFFQRSLKEYISNNYSIKQVEGFSSLFLLTETKGAVGVCGEFGIGAPSTIVIMEELIAHGVRNFIAIGTAGALQNDLPLNSIIVCEKAIRDEGTSHHYLKREKYALPSPSLTQAIKTKLDELQIEFISGTTWTIDAPYRETVAEIKQYQAEGVLTVEMEAAALFAVANYRKVDAAALVTISDYVEEHAWTPQFHSRGEQLAKLFRLALEVLTSSSR